MLFKGNTGMKIKIAVIEPDRRNAKLFNTLLSKKYDLCFTKNISDGYNLFVSENPDIIIIDPLYPNLEGIAFIKEIRSFNDCPIIAVSSNGTERAVVTVLNSGADDYIRKPYFSMELEARIDIAVKQIERLKAAKSLETSPTYKNGNLFLDFENRSLIIDKNHIHLTKNEFKILELLCRNAGKVLTYDFILNSVWGPRSNGNTGILRVNIANLRKKMEKDPLKPQYLLTENGIGYKVPENGENQ